MLMFCMKRELSALLAQKCFFIINFNPSSSHESLGIKQQPMSNKAWAIFDALETSAACSC